MTDIPRSSRPEVRNPVLGLKSVRKLVALFSPGLRIALADVLKEIAEEATVKRDECVRKCKYPMAAYWNAVRVYANHIARAIVRTHNGGPEC